MRCVRCVLSRTLDHDLVDRAGFKPVALGSSLGSSSVFISTVTATGVAIVAIVALVEALHSFCLRRFLRRTHTMQPMQQMHTVGPTMTPMSAALVRPHFPQCSQLRGPHRN